MVNTLIRAKIVLLLFVTIGGLGAADDDSVFFETKIAPLLESRCFKCHSHGSGKMKGGLTLDSRSGWKEGGDSGPAIVPGKLDDSLLIKAVHYEDPDLEMPPKEKLSDAEVALLEEWVRRGAFDPRQVVSPGAVSTDWWSLKPLIQPAIPDSSVEHPIDAFVRARLEEAGIEPSPEADRRTLIRRLYCDLHGLPPTPEAVEAFEDAPDPLAYEKLIDRLLDSPRYGERWARRWLDVIHFADSHGCEHDVKRPHAWRFRDYVIDRFNRDIPWARFIREQLAADVFYPDQPELTPALGFISAGPLELSRAGTAPVTFDYLDRDDMVTQTMAAFASTTANCARCHTHKFDPVTQEDYYALQAVFAGVGKGDVEYDHDPAIARQRRDWEALLSAAKTRDRDLLLDKKFQSVVEKWERDFAEKPASWEPLNADVFLSAEGSTLSREEDGSILAAGIRPDKDTYTVTSSYSRKRLTAIRLDVLRDDHLPMKGPGRQDNGNLHLTEFEARVFEPGAAESKVLKFSKATADWDQAGWTIAHTLDGNLKTAWGIFPKVGESHQAVFELESPVEWIAGARLVLSLRQLHGGGHLIGRFRLFGTDAPPDDAKVYPPRVLEALKLSSAERSGEQRLEIAAHALSDHAEKQLAALPEPTTVYAVSPSWSRAKKSSTPMPPKVVHLLRRGDIENPVREVPPGALSAIKGLPGRFKLEDPTREPERRAALADWLAAADNPLTWRNVVNRAWHDHFGRGICDTPNDFGRMGGEPTHPELLDWLAVWFRDEARGSLKELHRLILTSQTWKQESRVQASATVMEIDGNNRLVWRMNGRRLDAELFRDSALQIAGRLDLTIGGPGVEHFTTGKGQQSTPKLDYAAFDWNSPAATRRSIYRVVWRGIPDPFMEALDFPDLGLLAPKRDFSVSALQSLALFNNDFVLHASEWLAARLESEEETVDDQVRRAINLVWLREPTQGELKDFNRYAGAHGLASFCRVLFNSNEFLFVE